MEDGGGCWILSPVGWTQDKCVRKMDPKQELLWGLSLKRGDLRKFGGPFVV